MKDLLISKLREMVKVKKPKVKKTEPTEADRADFAAWQDRKEAEREPSDIEDERNQMAKHYGQQSEAIDFSKKTIAGKAARKTAAGALKAVKSRFQQAGLAKKPGDAAKLTKQYSQETYKHRESITAILSDKLEELKQSTVDSAAAKRVAQVRSKNFRGEEKPVFKGGTGGTDKPEQIGTRSGAGKGVIGKRLSTLYKGKTSKGVAAKREDSSTNLKDRMVDILLEAFLGTSRDYVARAMSREGKGSSMKDRSKKGKALASVINAQPKVVKAKAEKDAADDAQRKANMAKGGNSNLRSSDSATHWRNKWPSGSWGSA